MPRGLYLLLRKLTATPDQVGRKAGVRQWRVPDSSPDQLTTALVLLTPDGKTVARFADVQIMGTSAQHLTDGARTISGREVWLLHDGGIGTPWATGQARFEVLNSVNAAEEAAPPLPGARPWQLPGWRGEVLAWMEARLGHALTEPAWVHTSDLGGVLTARVGRRSRVYLKALEDGREVRAASQIAAQMPALTPPLLAADPQRGWLLTADAGRGLNESAELRHWDEAVRRLAQLHREGRWAGLRVHPFGALPEQLKRLLTPVNLTHFGLNDEQQQRILGTLPRLLDLCREVAALGMPECACHGDLHANNVLVQGDTVRLFDWSEACTAHPLTDIGWFLAYVMLPIRSGWPLRQHWPDLGERLWTSYQAETGLDTTLSWRDLALLALAHRAAASEIRFRGWRGTLPGFRPLIVPYVLKLIRHFVPSG
ncbi:phosphotransferase family protein [Deinococcus sp.]|uniref:phosphotransferase family protein n=1 Tax=Deinococcus sp. TaxID=47478 RepID=UPI003C7D69BD